MIKAVENIITRNTNTRFMEQTLESFESQRLHVKLLDEQVENTNEKGDFTREYSRKNTLKNDDLNTKIRGNPQYNTST
jgi:hypothetical protein